jgi:hypothetical protein
MKLENASSKRLCTVSDATHLLTFQVSTGHLGLGDGPTWHQCGELLLWKGYQNQQGPTQFPSAGQLTTRGLHLHQFQLPPLLRRGGSKIIGQHTIGGQNNSPYIFRVTTLTQNIVPELHNQFALHRFKT